MKKILKFIVLPFAVTIVGLLMYLNIVFPKVDHAQNIKIEYSQERIKRGEYLSNAVAVCMDCHSTRDWSKYSGPLVEGTLGKGGERFAQEFGFPGEYYSKNITPYGIGEWTDGELLRAITSGVSKDGSSLFPVMPHHVYGKCDKEDIYDIIAYIRSLKSIRNDVKKSKSDFPMNLIIKTIPSNPQFSKKPSIQNKIEYGKYLFTLASCNECHTKQEKGKPIVGMELAGGFEFPLPVGVLTRSANITPDKETGIGNFTEEMFVNKFKYYGDSSYKDVQVTTGAFNTVMPWKMYGKMKESDLKAIFAYLQTVKPIRNSVVKFEKR